MTHSVHEAPHVRLRERGEDALSDSELLGIALQISTGKAIDLLSSFGGSLRKLVAAAPESLAAHITDKQAQRLISIKELQGRLFQEGVAESCMVENSKDIVDLLQHKFRDLDHEVFSVVFLSTKHRVLKIEEMSRGTIDSASVYPREVVKRALILSSSAIIAVHNHPSGYPDPSREDQRLTHELRDACALLDISLLDHIIIGANGYFSFAEKGML